MQQDEAHRDILTWTENGQTNTISARLPVSQADWWARRRATDRVLNELGGVVTRLATTLWASSGRFTTPPMRWPRSSRNLPAISAPISTGRCIRTCSTSGQYRSQGRPLEAAAGAGPGHVAACGARNRCRHHRACGEFETAAAYANLAYVKPTITNWGDAAQSDYAIGFVCDQNAAGLKFICRSGFAQAGAERDYPLSNRFDEIEALVIFDDVLIPWENVSFWRSTRAARHIHATLHRDRPSPLSSAS